MQGYRFAKNTKQNSIYTYSSTIKFKTRLNEIGLSPGCLSWKDEFRRLFFLSPWSGINMEEKVPEAQGSLKWFTNYAGKQTQYDPRCPETICNAHYGKVCMIQT